MEKNKMTRFLMTCLISSLVAVNVMAVPAKRGWQTRTQADGTTIEVQVIGDEFYHYMINREGQQIRENENGMFEVVGAAPTREVVKARRAASKVRRQRKDVGTTPNLAPKGVVIIVNFKKKSMQSTHTNATFDELCNATVCTVNSGYPSAAQYFSDQSNGTYRPQFDVFGPVTLDNDYSYYGQNIDQYGNPTTLSGDGYDDKYATDAVIEACIKANKQYSNLNFADYDSDNDGYVDFVYVVYAGQGEADGGAHNTIWPHNYSIQEQISYVAKYPGQIFCEYTKDQTKLDGKYLDNYAMSAELSGDNVLDGIGTLCHEFGHVMGLPDLYDTAYGDNYDNLLTPNDWNIMDGGSYNADGHCPPNYDPWQKDFFGWHKPINLGNDGQYVTLYANGTSDYQAYQINANGSYVSPTTSGVRYYIENRQAQGWDAPLTGHGLLIWKVNFNESKWTSNEPNNTSNNPYYTIISATGTEIGSYRTTTGKVDNCPKNTFPGSGEVTLYEGISGKPLKDIAESNGVVTLTYIDAPAVDPFTVTWKADGENFTTTTSTGKVVLPATNPAACESGKEFVGWTATADYENETTAPTLVKAGNAVEEGAVFYAVYADKEGGSAEVNESVTFSEKKYDNQEEVEGKTITIGTNTSVVFNKGTNTNACKYYDGGAAIRVYGGGNFVVSSSNGNISKIVLSFGEQDKDNTISVDKGEFDGTTWEGDANKVTFTIGGTSGHRRIAGIAVTVGGGASYSNYSTSCGAAIECTLKSISVSGAKSEFKVGDTFSYEGLVVKAQFEEGECKEKTVQPTSVSTPNMGTAGNKTVTVTYELGEVTKTATYSIHVRALEQYEVRFYNNGNIEETKTVTEGNKVTLPTVTPCGDAYTFVGWWTAELDDHNTEAMNWITAAFVPDDDVELYAIYSLTEDGGGEAAFDGQTPGNYKIYADADDGTRYYAAKCFVSGTNMKIASTTTESEATSFTIAAVDNGFTIKDGDAFIAYSGSSTHVLESSSSYTWKIKSTNNGWYISETTNSTARILALSTAGISPVFGAYSTTNLNANGYYFDLQIGGGVASTTYYTSTLNCGGSGTIIDNTEEAMKAVKFLRNGELFIQIGDSVYSITGSRVK